MPAMTTYKIEINDPKSILNTHGLMPGGFVQKFLMNEVIRMSDPFVPFGESGILKNNIVRNPDGTYYEHIAPYARYHWYGKLMVDPVYNKGAFYSPNYGFWSRPGVKKKLTDKDLEYRGAPQRGPKWAERMWSQYGDQICNNIERMINDGFGG